MTDFEFATKLEAHKNTVYRLALSYLKNTHDAQDVTQEAFLKLFRCDKEFAAFENEKAWLIRITANLCKNKLRANKLRRSIPLDENLLVNQNIVFMESDLEVLDLLSGLNPKLYSVLYLFYYENYTTREIAKMLGVNENAVRTRLTRGREKLKEILNDSNDIIIGTKPEGGVIYGQQV